MHFVVASEQYVEFWRQPGTVQVGDFFVTISKKFTDESMKHFIGNTYTQFTVMESEQIAPKRFRIKVSSEKRLEFLGDGFDGLLFSVGLAEQEITLDESHHIVSLLVNKSTSSIVGGTGNMQQYENGTYTLKTIRNHVYQATLTLKPCERSSRSLIIWIITLMVLVTLGTMVVLKK